jgi:hypothetical protein
MQSQRTTRRRAVDVSCQQCGATFRPKPAEVAKGKGKYCSVACRAAAKLGVELRPVAERFWEKVDKNGPVPPYAPDLGPCWLWTAHIDTATGYGRFTVQRKTWNAHHWAYSTYVGPIPKGYDRDHLCRVRHCVNWGHLDPVPHKVNSRRGDAPNAILARAGQCKRGHEATDENVYRRKATGRIVFCRLCRAERRAAKDL